MSDLPEPYGILYQFAPELDKDIPDNLNAAIRLLEPNYNGVIIRFNSVRFEEDSKTQQVVVKYDYTLVSGQVNKEDIDDFHNILGCLIYDLILVKMTINEE